MYITFRDNKNNRKWSFDDLKELKVTNDAVKVLCQDGFRSIEKQVDFTDILLEKEEEAAFEDILYIFKAYNDDLAYGEEYIEVHRDKKKAQKSLEKLVLEDYAFLTDATCLEDLRNNPEFKDDIIEPDHVEIRLDSGATKHYIIEKKKVYE